MYCTSCGKSIDDDSKFCSFCGNAIKNESSLNVTMPIEKTIEDDKSKNYSNKKIINNNDIPTFTAPSDDIPIFTAPSNDIPTFTAPSNQNDNRNFCHYHNNEPMVGKCARCGKFLCQDCCDSYGVSAGEYAGQCLCYDCTQKLVAENVDILNKNLNKIKGQFILQLVGMLIGFIYGINTMGIEAALICACICGVFLRAIKAFGSIAWESIKIAINGQFGILTILSIMFELVVIVFRCIWVTITQTIQYITYIKKTSGFIESDSRFLEEIKEHMEYTMIRQQNIGVDLSVLMQEGGQLYNNSFAQMVRDQGEKRAESYMSQCVTRIAENGEIIRDFPNVA